MVVQLYTGPAVPRRHPAVGRGVLRSALRARVVELEAQLGREAHRTAVELLGVDEETARGVREAVQATLDMARGLGLADLLADDSRRRARVLKQWAVAGRALPPK